MADVVLAAVPTPFTAEGDLDIHGTRRVFSYIADEVDGLFLAGTTGEFPALDRDERIEVIEIGIEVAGIDRVIAQIGAPDAYWAARLAADVAQLGVTKIAAITPYYGTPLPAELTDYYLRIRDAAPGAELYAYLFPERTGLTLSPDDFAALAETVGLAGAKMSGSAAAQVAACAAACPGLKIYSGDDSDLNAVLRAGAAGVISARAAAFPRVFRELADALAAGDTAAAARHQADVESIMTLGVSTGRVKAALRHRGFVPMTSRMPADDPDEATSARIAELVKRL